jgi:hypothetical protein
LVQEAAEDYKDRISHEEDLRKKKEEVSQQEPRINENIFSGLNIPPNLDSSKLF